MADNIQVSTGSGATVATDDRSGVHIQRTDPIGTTALTFGRVSVSTSAVTLVAANATRRRVTFVNQGTGDVFIGNSGVTTSTGFRLAAGAGVTLETTATVLGIATSGTQTVHYIEEYDS